MNEQYLLEHLQAEFSRIQIENLIVQSELSDTEVAYDEGWANGFDYAVKIVKDHINKNRSTNE
jgi:hypothetical protein